MRIVDLMLAFSIFPCFTHATGLLLEQSPSPLQAESRPEALVPWETPIEGFFIRTHHPVPQVDIATWRLVIDGLVDKPLSLSLQDLQKMQKKSMHAVLECSGNARALQSPPVAGIPWGRGAVGNAEWSGVKLSELLRKAGVKSSARFATLQGADVPAMPSVPPFVRSVPLDKFLKEDSLLALQMNRQPLPPLHGGPARIVLPGWYAENWMKWVTRITLTDKEDERFYMKKAYRMPDVTTLHELPVQSLITEPHANMHAEAGPVWIRGKAFSGSAPIQKVEVSTDLGKTWRNAEVTSQRASGGWQEFNLQVSLMPGPLTIWSRATDARGNMQPIEHTWNPGGYMRNAIDVVTVQVAPASGAKIVENKCLSCHAKELILSQRLTPVQWGKVIEKMEAFGVVLQKEERESIIAHLAQFSPSVAAAQPRSMSYSVPQQKIKKTNSYDGKRAGAIFDQNCAVCHGANAEGKIGPRLSQRSFPSALFYDTVAKGKGVMPPFKTLSKQDIRSLSAFLQTK